MCPVHPVMVTFVLVLQLSVRQDPTLSLGHDVSDFDAAAPDR